MNVETEKLPRVNKKRPKTSAEWWSCFNGKRALADELLSLATTIARRHKRLSVDYVYSLITGVVRRINMEFGKYSRPFDSEQLEFIFILQQIIDQETCFDLETCGSDNIPTVSRLNAANINTLKRLLSDAIGTYANRLPPAPNAEDYVVVAKEIVKKTTVLLLRCFHNFLVTLPELNNEQQVMVQEIRGMLTRWDISPIPEVHPSNEPSQVISKPPVSFCEPLVEVIPTTEPPPPRIMQTWFRMLFSRF